MYSDVQEVHNLNFRHCLDGLANKILKIWSMAVTLRTAAFELHQLGHLKGRVYMCFGGCRL
jgi:hypothetical protein